MPPNYATPSNLERFLFVVGVGEEAGVEVEDLLFGEVAQTDNANRPLLAMED